MLTVALILITLGVAALGWAVDGLHRELERVRKEVEAARREAMIARSELSSLAGALYRTDEGLKGLSILVDQICPIVDAAAEIVAHNGGREIGDADGPT